MLLDSRRSHLGIASAPQVHAAKENIAALPGSARALSTARVGFNLLAFHIGHVHGLCLRVS